MSRVIAFFIFCFWGLLGGSVQRALTLGENAAAFGRPEIVDRQCIPEGDNVRGANRPRVLQRGERPPFASIVRGQLARREVRMQW